MLGRISIAENTMTKKQLQEEGVCFAYISTSQPSSNDVRGCTQGRNLGAGTEAEAMEKYCLLTGLLSMACSTDFCTIHPGSLSQGWH